MSRLPDAVLDDCRCDPAAPFTKAPARHFGLDKQRAPELEHLALAWPQRPPPLSAAVLAQA